MQLTAGCKQRLYTYYPQAVRILYAHRLCMHMLYAGCIRRLYASSTSIYAGPTRPCNINAARLLRHRYQHDESLYLSLEDLHLRSAFLGLSPGAHPLLLGVSQTLLERLSLRIHLTVPINSGVIGRSAPRLKLELQALGRSRPRHSGAGCRYI